MQNSFYELVDIRVDFSGVIVSGTGSSREFIQRLGRLLRKSEGKGQARLIELVSNETSETRTASRRRRRNESNTTGGEIEDKLAGDTQPYVKREETVESVRA